MPTKEPCCAIYDFEYKAEVSGAVLQKEKLVFFLYTPDKNLVKNPPAE